MDCSMPESEYDKVGDFYYEFVHDNDPAKNPVVDIVLSKILAEWGARVTGIEMLLRGEYRAFEDQWSSIVPRILVVKATKGLSGFND
jgi:hypothetical protein